MEHELFEKTINFLKLKQERDEIIDIKIESIPSNEIDSGYFILSMKIKNF